MIYNWSNCSLCGTYSDKNTVVARRGIAFNICDVCGSDYEKMRDLQYAEPPSFCGCLFLFIGFTVTYFYLLFFVDMPSVLESARIGLKEWLLK